MFNKTNSIITQDELLEIFATHHQLNKDFTILPLLYSNHTKQDGDNY